MTAAVSENLNGAEEMTDAPYKGEMHEVERRAAGFVFHLVERAFLLLVLLMTLLAVAGELVGIWRSQQITLGDLLMMFLYTEVVGMVAVFYMGRASTFVFPIFIAITALARLIILQGKDMKPENIVFEASAILLLTIAAGVIVRVGRS